MTLNRLLQIALLTTIPLFVCALDIRAVSADCIDLQSEGLRGAGSALVANERFLAIDDTLANRIVVYRRTPQRQWARVRTIALPPNPPISDDPSSIFGYIATRHKLAISGDKLVIGKVISKQVRPGSQEEALYPYKPPAEKGMAYAGAVYRTSLTSNSPLERIDRPKDKELAGLSVAADGGKIAFSVATYDSKSLGYVTVISGSRRYSLAASGEIAMKKNLLVAADLTVRERQGKLTIFNLADATPSPRTIAIPLPVKGLAIADKYIVVAEQLEVNQFPQSNPHISRFPKTLFVNIADLSITSVDGFGKISTYGNKLVRSYPSTADNESIGKIELFNLGTMPPKLLGSRKADIRRSFLAQDYLFTVEDRDSNSMICITSSSK
ncbi:hypothetical protein [Chamaesiphon sp. OTE_20_metabat_361]|uniref:hypothetical protein n=1 Tax=Chamaesiphon sp. OTE_20_metabat_361 TaxID=2964689 RepID=UPI00286D535F|nr:hypothetical protein [Chamaesiphon sp. OTE_20_metabat_361]